ncbi:hypothetical protein TWF706_010349 [Orbilia oligospora]|nr:hypothetical protein TWF706_010349 [Orbilia oligospora]
MSLAKPPSVPQPVRRHHQMFSIVRIQAAFQHDYWRENRLLIPKALSIMKKICLKVLAASGLEEGSGSFRQQPIDIQNNMYNDFRAILIEHSGEHQRLILDLLEATDPPGEGEFRGRRWLYNYCMGCAQDRRNRKQARDSKPKQSKGRMDYYATTPRLNSTHPRTF